MVIVSRKAQAEAAAVEGTVSVAEARTEPNRKELSSWSRNVQDVHTMLVCVAVHTLYKRVMALGFKNGHRATANLDQILGIS